VRAQRLPQLLVAALADQMQIELAEGGQEAVRVLHLDLVGAPAAFPAFPAHALLSVPALLALLALLAVVRDEQLVLRSLAQRQHPREEAVALLVQLGAQPLGQHRHRPCEGAQHAQLDAAAHRAGAEQRVRVVVRAGEQPLLVHVRERPRGPYAMAAAGAGPWRRRLPAAGPGLGRLRGKIGIGRVAGRGSGGHGGASLGGWGEI
jgi:hypothetical protein